MIPAAGTEFQSGHKTPVPIKVEMIFNPNQATSNQDSNRDHLSPHNSNKQPCFFSTKRKFSHKSIMSVRLATFGFSASSFSKEQRTNTAGCE